MKAYYLQLDGQRQGPFTFDDLRSKKITAQTPAWKEGMAGWTVAGNIDELAEFIAKEPPPFNSNVNQGNSKFDDIPSAFASATEKTGYKIGKRLGLTGVIILVIIITSFIIYKNNDNHYIPLPNITTHDKTPAELKAELLQKEQLNPAAYLTHKGTWHENLLGQMILEGTITNSATLANFKDIDLNVTWVTKTNTELAPLNYKVYIDVKAGRSNTYKITVAKPSSVGGVRIGVVSATAIR